MTHCVIRNRSTGGAVSLPPPYNIVLGAGKRVIVADSKATVLGYLGGAAGPDVELLDIPAAYAATTLPTLGPDAGRPAPASAGRSSYTATDRPVVYTSDGTAWYADRGGLPDGVGWTGWAAGNHMDGVAPAGSAWLMPAAGSSLVARFHVTSDDLAGAQRWLAGAGNVGNTRGWQVAFSNPGGDPGGKRLSFIIYAGGAAQGPQEIPVALTAGEHIAAFAFSTSGADLVVTWDMDGVHAGSHTYAGLAATYSPALALDPFSVGANLGHTIPLPADFVLRELVLLNAALTAAQLATITAGARVLTPSGVVEDYSLVGTVQAAAVLPTANGTTPAVVGGATSAATSITGTLTLSL